MNPYYSSRISDCRGLDEIPQSIDTSKRCLDDRTLRNDTSYLINQNMQNNITQNININNRTFQDNSNNGTFIIQNQNEILEDRAVSYINCSFNQPCYKKNNNEEDDEEPEQPDSPPQNEREVEIVGNDFQAPQQRGQEQEFVQQINYQDIENGSLNIRQQLNPPINFIQNPDREELDQQIQLQSDGQNSNMRNNLRINDSRNQQLNEIRNLDLLHQQHQQQYIRRLVQSRASNSNQLQNNQRNRNQNQLASNLPLSFQSFQQAAFPLNNLTNLQQQQLLIHNQNQIQRLQNQMNRYSQGASNQRLNRLRQNENIQNEEYSNFNQRQLQSYIDSLVQQNTILRMNLIRNQIRQLQRDDLSDQDSVNNRGNAEQDDQYRQVEQLNEIIRNTRRRMNEERRNNRPNQPQIGGRIQQVIELDEEDKVRAKIVFKKALFHLIFLSIFSVFMLAVFYLNFLLQGIWLIFFFVFCFFTGNKISIYKNLSEDVSTEERRMSFFNVVEYLFINVLFFMIFLFMRIISQPITLLFVYTPFVHIVWWLVFTTKTQESMNRHIELLLRLYAVTQILLFSVQFDQIVKWSWVSVLLPSWILLSSLGFYIFGLTILFLCSLYYCLVGQTDKYQIKGLIWCLMVSVHVVGNSLFFLLGLIDYYQEDTIQTLRYGSSALIAGSVICTLYTVACSDDLEIFIALANSESLFSGSHQVHIEAANQRDEENQDNNNDNLSNHESNQNNLEEQIQNAHNMAPNFSLAQNQIQPKKVKIIKTTKQIPSSIPQFLIRFSSTYFMKTDVSKEVAAHLEQKKKDRANKQNEEEEKNKQSQRDVDNKSKKNRLSTVSQNNGFEEINIPKDSQKGEGKGQACSSKENKQTERSRQDSKLTSQPSCLQCLVCFDNQPDSVILECGHGGLCNQCALDIWKKTGECYLCRQTISRIVQIDLNKQGKYKQIIAVSNMHEVSQEQDQMRLSYIIQENLIQQLQLLENQNNAQQNILNQQNQEGQIPSQAQNIQQQSDSQPQVPSENEIQLQQNNFAQINQENQIQNQQILSEEESNQQQQQNEIQNIQQIQLISQQQNISQQDQQYQQVGIEVLQDLNQGNNNQQNQLQVEQQREKEDITIIQYDESDEEIQNPDKRNHYQDTQINKVTLSSYNNQPNCQADFSSVNLSDFENFQNSITHEKKQDAVEDPNSLKTLSLDQLEKQMQEMNNYQNIQNCIGIYPSEVNSIKKPELSFNSLNLNAEKNNINAKNNTQSSSEQSINFEECQRQISEVQINQQSSQQQSNNTAQSIPAIIKIKKISQLDEKQEPSNQDNECEQNENSKQNKQISVKINQNQPSLQLDQHQNGISSMNKDKKSIQSDQIISSTQIDKRQNSSSKSNQVEWDIEETQQSTNRSVQAKLYQSGQYAIQSQIRNEEDKTQRSQYSQDTQKIQILDKYMSKYFNNLSDEQICSPDKEIFGVNNNKINQQINTNYENQYIINIGNDNQDDYAIQNKENQTNIQDQNPPLITRNLQNDQQKIKSENEQEQNQISNIQSDRLTFKLDEQKVEEQVSNCTIDRETQLINFDDE